MRFCEILHLKMAEAFFGERQGIENIIERDSTLRTFRGKTPRAHKCCSDCCSSLLRRNIVFLDSNAERINIFLSLFVTLGIVSNGDGLLVVRNSGIASFVSSGGSLDLYVANGSFHRLVFRMTILFFSEDRII